MCAAQSSSKPSENDIASEEKYAGDYFCSTGVIDEFKEVPKDFPTSYSEDGVFSENEKDFFIDQAEYVDKKVKDVSKLEGTSNKASANFSKDADCDVEALCDSETTSENVHSELKSCQNKMPIPEADKLLSRPLPKFYQAKESGNINIHGNCLAHGRKGYNSQMSKENVLKESEFVRENLRQLKEKINTLAQEHQKMAILQSFLRYKKFKLEETARNLDEKRIEIANWECNLLKKAKGLLEKEQWLNSKGEKLQCKEQQLAEWEKSLNKEIKKEASHDFHNYRNDEKESLFTERKFGLDSCHEAPWDEVSASNVYRGEDNEEFAYFSSTPKRVSNNVSSIERCVSDGSSLDELEKNIVFMEKMSSPSETNNSSFDDKSEHASFNINKKKDDISSCDPLGYSKGRRYLPEHMKYWLDKRDRSTM